MTTPTTASIETNAKGLGNDRLLFGMILGVLAFWLFAQTMLNIAPTMAADLAIQVSVMNIAVSIMALFSGIFIVVIGGLADRLGRVKIVQWGFILSIVGSLLIGLAPSGARASTSLILGRICQGLSGACIMPASLALVKAYWDGAARQRAVSLWSMGSWGGSGFAALFGGLVAENLGWRWIFFASAAVSVIGMLMVRGTLESRSETTRGYKFDTQGVLTFMIAMVALQVFATQGAKLGWTSIASLGLLAISAVFGAIFFRTESGECQRLRGLRTLQEYDVHGDDALESAAQCCCRDSYRVHDIGTDRRRDERPGRRPADAWVRRGHSGPSSESVRSCCSVLARAGR